jgi:hypothetical protein
MWLVALYLAMATSHWNLGTTGFYKDPQFTRGGETP